jgi:hypothetical protein
MTFIGVRKESHDHARRFLGAGEAPFEQIVLEILDLTLLCIEIDPEEITARCVFESILEHLLERPDLQIRWFDRVLWRAATREQADAQDAATQGTALPTRPSHAATEPGGYPRDHF